MDSEDKALSIAAALGAVLVASTLLYMPWKMTATKYVSSNFAGSSPAITLDVSEVRYLSTIVVESRPTNAWGFSVSFIDEDMAQDYFGCGEYGGPHCQQVYVFMARMFVQWLVIAAICGAVYYGLLRMHKRNL